MTAEEILQEYKVRGFNSGNAPAGTFHIDVALAIEIILLKEEIKKLKESL